VLDETDTSDPDELAARDMRWAMRRNREGDEVRFDRNALAVLGLLPGCKPFRRAMLSFLASCGSSNGVSLTTSHLKTGRSLQTGRTRTPLMKRTTMRKEATTSN